MSPCPLLRSPRIQCHRYHPLYAPAAAPQATGLPQYSRLHQEPSIPRHRVHVGDLGEPLLSVGSDINVQERGCKGLSLDRPSTTLDTVGMDICYGDGVPRAVTPTASCSSTVPPAKPGSTVSKICMARPFQMHSGASLSMPGVSLVASSATSILNVRGTKSAISSTLTLFVSLHPLPTVSPRTAWSKAIGK